MRQRCNRRPCSETVNLAVSCKQLSVYCALLHPSVCPLPIAAASCRRSCTGTILLPLFARATDRFTPSDHHAGETVGGKNHLGNTARSTTMIVGLRQAPVGASPSPAEGCTMKRKLASILFTNTLLKQFPHLTRWRGRGPLHHHHGHAPIRAHGQRLRCCAVSHLVSATQTMVAQHPHTPLWVCRADVDSTHQTLMGD